MNKQQLASKIWAAANEMRSKIEASEYKDYSILADIDVFFTENHEEQSKIGEYFSDIDNLITLHQRTSIKTKFSAQTLLLPLRPKTSSRRLFPATS